jgi:hypothetical protein
MGKIQPNPADMKPVDDEIELDDTTPAFEKEDDEEEITVQEEGAVTADPEEETPAAPVVPAKPEDQPKYVFKTQEELDAFIEAQNKKKTPAAPTEPEKTDEDELKDLIFWKGQVDENGKWVGEKPADWNDFARTIIKHLSPKTYAPKVLEEIKNMTAAEKREMETINAEFDAEYDEIAATGAVPKRGTKEGDEVNAQISLIGGQYGLTSIKKAHELWSKIPKEQGGGLSFKPAAPKTNPSKEASRLIGGSKGSQTSSRPSTKIPYSKLHAARSLDELLDE